MTYLFLFVRAEASLAAIKEEFGAASCFLLTVNSRPPGERDDTGHLPDPWSQFLNKHIEPQVQFRVLNITGL